MLAALVTLGVGPVRGQDYTVPDNTPANIRLAVGSGARAAADRERDANRKPAEILSLAGIDPGDRVVEFASFGHYYTTLLTEAVGPSGHVYMVDMPWIEPFGGEAARAFDAAHDNATFMQAHYNEVDLPAGVDAAMMVLFYHDLKRDSAEQSVDTADMNARVFRALKPGGTFVVIDHKAASGSGWRDATTLHRIDAQTIIDEVTAAGFVLANSSDVLANAADDHTLNMRDPAIRGMTDRAVLVFRKPPEYVSIEMEIDVAKPAAEVWAKVGDYCAISEWLNVDCEITSGDGGMGTVRSLVNGRIVEILVARTDLSYGYTQPAVEGQFYNLYHGFLEAKPVTANSSKLLYTLVYDISDKADAAAKEADMARRRSTFENALRNMKEMAEAP